MHLAALYTRLDQLYDKVIGSKSVAHARRLCAANFFQRCTNARKK
jgi:hypothetical protein